MDSLLHAIIASLILILLPYGESLLKRENLKLNLQVKYPISRLKTKQPSNSQMWIRGDGLGLSWQHGKKMNRAQEMDTWSLTLSYSLTINGYSCEQGECHLKQLQFRIYLDNDKDMLGANFAVSLPVSRSQTKYFTNTPTVIRYPWFFSRNGSLTAWSVYSPELKENRSILSYLPPSFNENTYKKYAMVFLHDGDDLNATEKLPFNQQVDRLILNTRSMQEVILVGVRNNATERTRLLTTVNGTDYTCRKGTLVNNCDGCLTCWGIIRFCTDSEQFEEMSRCFIYFPCEPRGEQYLDFIVKTLLPNVSSKYRGSKDRNKVGVMGFSLGGLISCHAAWTRPEVFGVAACMSSSFWWPSPSVPSPEKSQYHFINVTLKANTTGRPYQNIYIDVGSNETTLMVEPAETVVNKLAAMQEFDIDENLWLFIFDGEIHTKNALYNRLWMPLTTLFPTEGSPQSPHTAPQVNSSVKPSSLFYIIMCFFYLVIKLI